MTVQEIPTVEIAKFMREELKEVFPQTTFTVHKTGYDSIQVEWTDGPTQAEVEFLLDQFKGYRVDPNASPYDDSPYRRVTSRRLINDNRVEVQYTLQYINFHRRHSQMLLATVAIDVSERFQLEPLKITPEVNDGKVRISASIEHSGQRIGSDWAENYIYREMNRTSTIDYKTKSPAEKFRKAADALQKTIDDKRRSRPTHTRRMKNMADNALAEALKLELVQDKLRALADAWDQGHCPVPLRTVNTKAQVEYLADESARERDHAIGLASPDGWGRDTYLMFAKIGLGSREKYSDAVSAMRMLGDPDAGKKTAADELADLEREILLTKIPGFFPTPNPVINQMFIHAPSFTPGMRILEPSAGNGRIAEWIRERYPEATLDVCEWNYNLGKILTMKGFNLIGSDCFEITEPIYDLIVANPPFEGLADTDHVRHYYKLLKPGGTLISVMGASTFFVKYSKAVIFLDWLDEVGNAYDLPDGAFKDSERPTGVKTRFVVIHKPEANCIEPVDKGISPQPLPTPVCDKCGHSTDLILPDAPAGSRLCWDCLALEQQVTLKLSTDATAYDLAGKIDRCKAIMAQTEPIWNKPFEAPGVFDTGGSNRPKSLDRMVDAENKRRSEAFARYQQAEKDLGFYQSRLAAYEAGEVHANGQPKADSPSRQRREAAKQDYALFIQATVKVGDQVALTQNLNNHVTIKRLNRKTITTTSGTIWEYDEITPLIDGKAMTNDQLKESLRVFFNPQPDTDVSPRPLPPYTIDQMIENTPWRSPDGTKDGGWKQYKVLELRPGGVKIDLGNNELWVKADNCREISAVSLEKQHYDAVYQQGLAEVEQSGLKVGDRVVIAWTTIAPTCSTIIEFGKDNPAWVLLDNIPPYGRAWIAINGLTKASDSMAIIPAGECFTLVEATGRKRTLPPIRMVPVKDTAQRVPEPMPEQLRLF